MATTTVASHLAAASDFSDSRPHGDSCDLHDSRRIASSGVSRTIATASVAAMWLMLSLAWGCSSCLLLEQMTD